jgi:hypothetical protein
VSDDPELRAEIYEMTEAIYWPTENGEWEGQARRWSKSDETEKKRRGRKDRNRGKKAKAKRTAPPVREGEEGAHCAICGEPMWTADEDAPASHVRHDHPEDHPPVREGEE